MRFLKFWQHPDFISAFWLWILPGNSDRCLRQIGGGLRVTAEIHGRDRDPGKVTLAVLINVRQEDDLDVADVARGGNAAVVVDLTVAGALRVASLTRIPPTHPSRYAHRPAG
jgi:hypothetical protein